MAPFSQFSQSRIETDYLESETFPFSVISRRPCDVTVFHK